ncbi:PREDICTED: uncharacterized protein LOC103319201 [Prunus mume]|uniref:Uncharacterized protein LOC103319201 n=1 Tax=Prunus mume TaxID=102107 RepID=A0ABM0N3F7_PRUMU|nr:PREDICTED: uncharacterized protein LOC103319201 [Prunus mume]
MDGVFSMEEYMRCLERHEQERKKRNRRADEINELQRQVDEQVLIAVAMEEEENQGRRRGSQVGRRRNVDRHRKHILLSMLNLSRVLERQHKQSEEIWRRRVREDQDADEEEEQMLAATHDAVGALGLIPEQKLTTALRILAYRASAEQVDEIVRMRKSIILECLVRFCDAVENLYTSEYLRKPTSSDLQRLLQKGEARGFPGMIGSIDCMHWQWKNFPTAWQREYGNQKGQKSIILEPIALFDCWIWHTFFGVAGSQNDLNVFGQSPVFDEVLRGHSPQVTYQINNTVYTGAYYLADGIYPR